MSNSIKSWFKKSGSTLSTKISGLTLAISGLSVSGSQKIKRTDAGAADYNPSAATTDYLITADNTAAPRAIIISNEDIADGSTADPRVFTIIDEYGNATAQNLTVSLENGGTIAGQASIVLSADYNAIDLYIDGTNAYIT